MATPNHTQSTPPSGLHHMEKHGFHSLTFWPLLLPNNLSESLARVSKEHVWSYVAALMMTGSQPACPAVVTGTLEFLQHLEVWK